ncbi:YdcF family protein [Pseudobutyrivibrio xylanivorans]|uniref:YdcF family protein n=1 Tax=Pseudobutyrivibrio xylanivorans TaxID=185007 RepID=A0A5P6VNI9_PSEXY|nr:YdcF family protein [Pseudobutyrivibrio xylanivorans]QFJ54235.1 YdcF family protein [Pseudobutyrivibrio xylanivorans]
MALAVLSLLYSITVFLVGSGTFSYVIWILVALFFGFLWFMEKKGLWDKVPWILRRIFRVLIILGLAVFIICQGGILTQFFSKGEDGADYIIVLGAQMREGGPSAVYKYRLDAAVEYLNNNPETIAIVTGGQGANEPISEGDGGKAYLMDKGISEERILVEKDSFDTKQNITNALNLIEDDENMKIGIVTNNFHLFRGTLLARRYTDAEITGIAAYTEYQFLPNNMVRETFGIIKDIR